MRLTLLALLLVACPDTTGKTTADRDADGIPEAEDCDDADADLGAPRAWFVDADRDGHGDATGATEACDRPEGHAATNDDCDDAASSVYPGAPELCDGLDNDCDGAVDLADPDLDPDAVATVYTDADADGFGDDATAESACAAGSGQATEGGDCDDADAAVHPGAAEVCNGADDDCDGLTDDVDPDAEGSLWYEDQDDDGHGDARTTLAACDPPPGWAAAGDDCDDADAAIHPGAAEADCTDPVDYNCDGSTGYDDADRDGAAACEDCDDADNDVLPGAPERCNGRDDDCDGAADDAATDAVSWYADADGDGYGDAASVTVACTAPAGTVADAADCDDTDPGISPSATERCNGVDDDCDAETDEGDAADATTWYADDDGDTHGDPGDPQPACSAPAGHVADATDCDDTDAAVSPSAAELCNGQDDDCDAEIDEASATDALSWYADADGDTYGDAGAATLACTRPAGLVADDDDCDDTDAAVHPAAAESCNGIDDDCDGSVDENGATDADTFYADADGDGDGDVAAPTLACSQPAGTVRNAGDCNDLDATVYSGASETCDGVDEDCDGTVDDNAIDKSSWYPDNDADGYGDDAVAATLSCTAPAGFVADDTDCDDAAADANPGESETCDTVDNDCDGAKDEAGCPCSVEEYGGHAYLYCTSASAWTAAQATCQLYGYELVSIGSSAENIVVVDEAYSRSATRWWIGYNDAGTEGSWVWSNGAATTYTNWHSGEPNNAGNEDCGELLRWTDYTWNDEPCTDSLPFVCEE